MATDIQITNNALSLIGAGQITGANLAASTDTSREATISKALYQQNKEWLLSSAIWHFAKKKDELFNEGPPDDSNEWAYFYKVPGDFVKLVKFYPTTFDFTIFEKQRIYSNDAGPLELTYIADIAEADWPEYFRAMFEFYWAARLALPITRKPELSREMINQFQSMWDSTVVANAEQVPTESFGNNPFIDFR